MLLKFKPFAASSAMAEALKNKHPLKVGAHGPAVALLQGGLVQMGYTMPKSLRKGLPDGVFGVETSAAVKAFQAKAGLPVTGVAGGKTVAALDSALVATVKPTLVKPPAPPPTPGPRHYRMGADDPPIKPDPGAGVWRSKPVSPGIAALKVAILMRIGEAAVLVGRDAAKHMQHYLQNSGRDYTIDLDGMLKEVEPARKALAAEIQQAQLYVEGLAPGRYEITSTTAQQDYNEEEVNRNWYYAIGGYSYWGKGVATVAERTGEREYTLDFEYKVADRYNWDGHKSVTLFGVHITDEFMGEFHRQGLAREFNCYGSLRRTIKWKHSEAIRLKLNLQPKKDRV